MTTALILIAETIVASAYGALALWLEPRRDWRAETDSDQWHSPGLVDDEEPAGERLTSPEPLPARRKPGTHLDDDLAALAVAGRTAPSVDDEVLGRVLTGLRSSADDPHPDRYRPQHRAGRVREARQPGRPSWDTDTEAFFILMGSTWNTAERQALIAEWMCLSCKVGREGEHRHQSCTGCSCPCGMAVSDVR